MIDIRKREDLKRVLNKVEPDTPAQFGKMNAQQMVEHLSLLIRLSNGKMKAEVYLKGNQLEKFRSFLYSDKEIQPGFSPPMLDKEPSPLRFSSIDGAVIRLFKELDDFESYYKNQPTAKEIHPYFGALPYEGWVRFHNKHFTHHFKQFDLL